MGVTNKKEIGLITQLIPVMVITVTAIFLNWICDKVLFRTGYPGFLSISDSINISDLLIGVFTAQLAMVTIATGFSGLINQMFNTDDKYLGISLRDVILSRPYYGLTFLSLLGTSLFTSILSYYFVAQRHIVSTVSLFIANIVIVFILFLRYVKNTTIIDQAKFDIRNSIAQDVIQEVNDENLRIKDLLK